MKKILVGFDGSENSFKALTEALTLAKKYDAAIEAVSVEEVPRFAETIGEFVEEKNAAEGRYGPAIKIRKGNGKIIRNRYALPCYYRP
jgi:nucleotide-binding universal stress UspA family protein